MDAVRGYITADPAICHGKPIFKGTRIMVHLVLEMMAAGENMKDILKDYPSLTAEHIKAALLYASATVKEGEVANLS